jgi:hypothetical protein
METLKDWLGLAALVISVGGFLWTQLTSGGSKALSAVTKLREDVDSAVTKLREEFEAAKDGDTEKRQIQSDAIVARFHLAEARLLKAESDLAHLPDRTQTHRLELAVERLNGRMETLDERLKPVAAISDRLQEFLLEQARK